MSKAFLNLIKFSITLFLALSISSCQINELQQKNSTNLMSLNIYGWKTMPAQAHIYANLIKQERIDILVVQEGVEDWKIQSSMPNDYAKAQALLLALGQCWQRKWQIFINVCNGINFKLTKRFDLADGPNAIRTGEYAHIIANENSLIVINSHWDHESLEARVKSAAQTAMQLSSINNTPVILAGDFNTPCQDAHQLLSNHLSLELEVDGGIDCIFGRMIDTLGRVITAEPSDHPAVIVTIK